MGPFLEVSQSRSSVSRTRMTTTTTTTTGRRRTTRERRWKSKLVRASETI